MTSKQTPFPAYVYKILPDAPPSILPHALPFSDLDQKDGFIHLSDAGQVPKTAVLFFNENSTLWLLKISTAVIEAEGARLVWAEGLPGCVHLYGAKGAMGRLGEGNVVSVKDIQRSDGQDWVAATSGDTWLE